MRALILSDEISIFHWSMLKSVLLILSLLPVSQVFLNLLHGADASSQIMIGFMAVSVFSALAILSFYSALNMMSVQLKTKLSSKIEQYSIHLYRHIPMLFLAVMVSYLAVQL